MYEIAINNRRRAVTYKNRTRNRQQRFKLNHNAFKLSVLIFTIVFICLAGIITAAAESRVDNVATQYKSVLVQDGDTLWDIANEHNNQTFSCMSNSDYIDSVMNINKISSDSITAGNYIIVPIYVIEE